MLHKAGDRLEVSSAVFVELFGNELALMCQRQGANVQKTWCFAPLFGPNALEMNLLILTQKLVVRVVKCHFHIYGYLLP